MRFRSAVLGAAIGAGLTSAIDAASPGYCREPALHGDRLIFASEGDLWTARLPEDADALSAPIIAYRLTSSPGREGAARINADGTMIAFTAEYDGNADVYIMPIDGGAPKRLTFHPGDDRVVSWSADGRSVLFASPRSHPFEHPELHEVSTAGGMPLRFEFGDVSQAAMSTTGRVIAFSRVARDRIMWKGYRGGTAPEIWVGEPDSGLFLNLTENEANDLYPTFVLGRVFYVSDRDGHTNIYSDTPRKGDVKQHTTFAPDAADPTAPAGYELRDLNGDAARRGSRLVFSQGGRLALYDVRDESLTRLDVQLASDRLGARARPTSIREHLSEFALSPDGDRLLIGARGELVLAPLDVGGPFQLTRSADAREWGATYAGPENIVMISDATGEQQIAIVGSEGGAPPSAMTEDREAWLFPPVASPSGDGVVFADKTMRLHYLSLRTLDRVQIDQSEAGEITDYRFSPDGQWVAYAKPMPNGLHSIWLYSVRTSRTFEVSAGQYDDIEPRWDPQGKYLYFLSHRHFNPWVDDFDLRAASLPGMQVVAVPLTGATPPPHPLAALTTGFDLKAWANGELAEQERLIQLQDEGADLAEIGDPMADWTVALDPDGIAERQHLLPIQPGAYADLEAVAGGVLFRETAMQGLLDDDDFGADAAQVGQLVHYNLLEEEGQVIRPDVAAYTVSGSKARLALLTAEGFLHGEVGGELEAVDLGDVNLIIDPPAEWGQILAEAWRLQRDFFFAPNFVGVDWAAMKTKYEALLPILADRNDLNDVIAQMLSELRTSHAYVWGGDQRRRAQPVAVGLLGLDLTPTAGGVRIDRVLPGHPGAVERRSPLHGAHLDVEAGDFLVAVDGAPVGLGVNVFELLQDKAGEPVAVSVSDDAGGMGKRTYTVVTLPDESALRYTTWVEDNRRAVAEASDGRIGYIHIPDMMGRGLALFFEQFRSQTKKPAVIIDVRDNGGGFVSQMILDRLMRTPTGYFKPRHGSVETIPARALNAHMVALINQYAGSDGDIFPESFRLRGLGPLIGTRTWGGVVGIRGDKPFVDRGLSTQPEFAWWEPSRGWSLENSGVAPDIEVDITPADELAGRDPQLDRAIRELRQKLETQPRPEPTPPPYPVR